MGCNNSVFKKLSLALAVCFFSLLLLPSSSIAQSNDSPTWNSKQTKIPAGNHTREIKDIFAQDAVVFEDLLRIAKFMPYVKDEIVVAIQHSIDPTLASKHFREVQWSKYLPGFNPSFISVVLTNKAAGKTVSLVHLQLPAGTDVMEIAGKIGLSNGILWVSPNFYETGDPRDHTPNDPMYSNQYHHPLMQNNLGWDITKGNPNIIVAVADDGVQLAHPDLSQNIWINSDEIPGDGIDNDNNGYIDDVNGWDFSFNNNDPNSNITDDNHGTHVGGIIGARIDNGTGVAGVAGLTTIMPLQFYGTGGASWTSTVIANTFAYAVANGAKILNCSYNVDGFASNPIFIAATQHLLDNNVLYFNSAGNNNQLNPVRQNITQGLFVTSTTSTDTRSSFSNYGVGMDVAAPGTSILATLTNGLYGSMSGTSMSTPNAAGAAALIWGHNPTWNAYQVAAQLLGTADDISAANPSVSHLLGSGRVNTYKALTNTLPAPRVKELTGLPIGNVTPSNAPTGFSLSFSQVMDAASVNNASNIELRSSGPNDIFNDGDDIIISLTSYAPYRIGTNTMNFDIDDALACGNYRLSIISNGVKNPFNTPLDGNNDGTGGDNYVYEFSVKDIFYLDNDGDGYGTSSTTMLALCNTTPSGYVLVAGDCDDNNPNVNPGATEICNGIDDDCDGVTDIEVTNVTIASTNPSAILLPLNGTGAFSGSPASNYPSTITVAGITSLVETVAIKIKGITHSYFNDLDFILESPSGTKMKVFSDVTEANVNYENLSFTIADNGFDAPISVILTSGAIYKPTDYNEGVDEFPGVTGTIHMPAPSGTATLTSVFGGESANGDWKLYIVDDYAGDIGQMLGWELIITTQASVCNAIETPTVAVVQPSCSNNFGSIEVISPLDPSYTYSIGGAYQSSPVFTNLIAGSYTVTVRDNLSNTSEAANVVMSYSGALPTTPDEIRGHVNVCAYIGTSTVLDFSVSPLSDATSYTWTLPSTLTYVSGQGTNSIQVTVNANFTSSLDRTIHVVATNGCGTSSASSVTLKAQIPTTPRAIVASSNDICSSISSNTPITYTIPKAPGAASYNWTIDMTGITSVVHPNPAGENDTTVVITFTNAFTSRTLQVSAVNNCGVSNYRSLHLNFNGVISIGMISGPTNVCQYVGNGSPLAVYSVPNIPGVSYSWLIPDMATNITQSGNQVSFNYSSNFSGGTLIVHAMNGCGLNSQRQLRVGILSPRAPSTIEVEELQICPDRIFRYSISPTDDTISTIVWTVPAGATILSGANTNVITVSYPNTAVVGNVTVQLQSACGNSSQRVLKVKMATCASPSFKMNEGLFVDIYPNPSNATSKLSIRSNELEKAVFVRVLDVHGRAIRQMKTTANTILDIQGDLMPGVYLIEVTQGKQKEIRKFIKL